jgi:hypothetical protein
MELLGPLENHKQSGKASILSGFCCGISSSAEPISQQIGPGNLAVKQDQKKSRQDKDF